MDANITFGLETQESDLECCWDILIPCCHEKHIGINVDYMPALGGDWNVTLHSRENEEEHLTPPQTDPTYSSYVKMQLRQCSVTMLQKCSFGHWEAAPWKYLCVAMAIQGMLFLIPSENKTVV